MSDTRKIVVKGHFLRKEGTAAAVITPGMLVELTSTGEYQPFSAANGLSGAKVATEYEVGGKGVDDNYAIGDWVFVDTLTSGGEFYAAVAAGQAAIAVGDRLNTVAGGTVGSAAAGAANQAIALEAVDNSGGAAITWILCEVL